MDLGEVGAVPVLAWNGVSRHRGRPAHGMHSALPGADCVRVEPSPGDHDLFGHARDPVHLVHHLPSPQGGMWAPACDCVVEEHPLVRQRVFIQKEACRVGARTAVVLVVRVGVPARPECGLELRVLPEDGHQEQPLVFCEVEDRIDVGGSLLVQAAELGPLGVLGREVGDPDARERAPRSRELPEPAFVVVQPAARGPTEVEPEWHEWGAVRTSEAKTLSVDGPRQLTRRQRRRTGLRGVLRPGGSSQRVPRLKRTKTKPPGSVAPERRTECLLAVREGHECGHRGLERDGVQGG